MNKAAKKIGLILLLAVLLPSLFFLAWEINSLNDSESMLEEIYENQLTAILNSVNQHSEDVINTRASDLNYILSGDESASQNAEFEAFLNKNEEIAGLFIADSSLIGDVKIFGEKARDSSGSEIKKSLLSNRTIINRLHGYLQNNFRKIEPIVSEATDTLSTLIFISDNKLVCGFILDGRRFINRIIAPKLGQIPREDFIISAIETGSNRVIYSNDVPEEENISPIKPMRLLPAYSLGISLKGRSIRGLVKQRTYTNLLVLILLNLTLFAGVWFVFRNVKKEVELAQIKSDFVSNVSHELRTPLALISMFSETLQMGRVKTEKKKQEYYSILSQETNRLSRIVNKILSFSQIEAGKRKYSFAEIDLNEVAGNVFMTYGFHLENKGFEFSFEKNSEPLLISGDKEAIAEAIINLIDNAVKYSGENKNVKISVGKSGNSVYVEIEDNGIGISDEDRKMIYDKFYRVSHGLVHNTKGTGLGLTIVEHIIQAHAGKIELKSKLNEGSSFKLIFPAK